METIKKELMKGTYKTVSLLNVTVNKMIKPATEEIVNAIDSSIIIENDNSSTSNEILNGLKKTLKTGIAFTKGITITPINFLGEFCEKTQLDVERKLKIEYNIDTNQWIFSSDNLTVLEKINALIQNTTSDVKQIGSIKCIQYLIAWTIVQKVHRIFKKKEIIDSLEGTNLFNTDISISESDQKLIDEMAASELSPIKVEVAHFSLFAHGPYGDLMNYVYSLKDISKIIRNIDYDKEFLFHTKIPKKDLYASFWEATPYHPAYCICKDIPTNSIILCARGSNNWADFVTDLDFEYLNFWIIKDQNGKYYLKLNPNNHTNLKLWGKVSTSTREFNHHTYNNENILNNNESYTYENEGEIIQGGFAHSGMLLSALDLYKEVSPKIEKIFHDPDNQDCNLVITGHSLGGGITTLLIMLFLLHPPKTIEKNIRSRLRGYCFGGAKVLSYEMRPLFDGIIYNVINQYDIVPRLDYGSIKDLFNVIIEFDKIEKRDKGFISKITDNVLQKDISDMSEQEKVHLKCLLDVYDFIKTQKMNNFKLSHMGRTFLIEKKSEKEDMLISSKTKYLKEDKISDDYNFSFKEIMNSAYFDEIINSKNLIKHHFPHLYEEALYSPNVTYAFE